MEVTDIIIGGALLFGLGRGLWKGFFVELASLLSLILGIFIAVKFSGYLAAILAEHVSWQPRYISITAFIIIFVGVIVCMALLAKALTKAANATGLGLLNRFMGGVFGFLKMLLIVSVLLNFFVKLNRNYSLASKESLEKSTLFYPVLEISGIIFPVLEEWFFDFKEGGEIYFEDDTRPEEEKKDTITPYDDDDTQEADPDLFNQRA